jgi:hypothetical protein
LLWVQIGASTFTLQLKALRQTQLFTKSPFVMIFILISVTLLLCATIIYLGVYSHREKEKFRKKEAALEEIIVQITQKQIIQSGQLRLSDELDENLKKSRIILNDDIFKLNYELFDTLSKNDLLKNKPES